MSVNQYRPHILVLPEDDATRELANGFCLHQSLDGRRIQVLNETGGWNKAVDALLTTHVPELRRNPHRHLVLVIDFDNEADRLQYVQSQVPEDLRQRVFVVGVLSEPEDLRRETGEKFEAIGRILADDCCREAAGMWGHRLLAHNAAELARMQAQVRPFLFD